MVYDSISEIRDMVAEKERENEELRVRMDADFDLLTLLEYEPKDQAGNQRKGYESYTSSAPKNFFNKTLDGLNRAALSIQIKLPEDAKEKDRRSASTGELFLFGALHAVDRRLNKRGEPPLREGLGFLMCLRGWWAARALVYVPEGKTDTIFDVQPWDPLNSTWEVGPEGLIWAANKRVVTKAQVKAEYDIDIEGKTTTLIDFWDTEANSVIIGDAWGKEPQEHGIGHVPVNVGAVGSMPTLQARSESSSSSVDNAGEESLIQYRGDSVWAASRNLYEAKNRQVSTLMDVQRRASVGSLMHVSPNGTKDLLGDPYGVFRIIEMEPGETLTPLELPKAPPEAGVLLNIVDDDLQQSTLPYPLAFGGTKQALSGRALAYLGDQTKSVYSPRTGALSNVYTWLCEEFLGQFATKGFKSAELKGFHPKTEAFFHTTIKPKDINPNWYVEVKVEPRMPRDEESEIMMALAATQKRGPGEQRLMSYQTARENIIQLRDPEAEEDRVLVEEGQSLPPVVGARIAKALQDAGDEEGAEIIVAWMGSQGMGGPPPGAAAPPGAPPGAPPAAPPGIPPGAPPGAPQAPGPGAGEEPPQVQVIKAVLGALEELGAGELGQGLAQALQSGQPPPPRLVDTVVRFLSDSGQEQLAQAFLTVMQMLQGSPAGSPGGV